MRPAIVLLSILLLAATAPTSRAQALHGEWFKLTVTAEGTGLNPETQLAEKGKLKKLVRYAQLLLLEGPGAPTYEVQAYAPTEAGEWVTDTGGTLEMLDLEETFVISASLLLTTKPFPAVEGAPNLLNLEFNGPVKAKVKNEELKSATIKTLGSTSYFTNDAFAYHGKAKCTLTRVPVAKLPFVPPVMATAAGAAPAAGTAAAQPAAVR